jgi:hypothetical protein
VVAVAQKAVMQIEVFDWLGQNLFAGLSSGRRGRFQQLIRDRGNEHQIAPHGVLRSGRDVHNSGRSNAECY